MIMLTHEQGLKNGLDKLGISASSEQLLAYLGLLAKWNQAYNLTAIRNIEDMISRHVLDSLAISPWVKGSRLIDVGSGAGLPGIPLAIAFPDLQVVLLDSNGKKIRFMQEVKRSLSLNNIEVVESRAENYHPRTPFDTVTSRAFSELAQMLNWTRHLIAEKGIWLAMKGRYPEMELEAINHPYHVNTYTVPNLDQERCCVIIDNVSKE